MKKNIVIVVVLFVVGCYGSYLMGCRWANLKSFEVGYDTGYGEGIEDAQAAYKANGNDGVQVVVDHDRKIYALKYGN